jgi:hypothetical protein
MRRRTVRGRCWRLMGGVRGERELSCFAREPPCQVIMHLNRHAPGRPKPRAAQAAPPIALTRRLIPPQAVGKPVNISQSCPVRQASSVKLTRYFEATCNRSDRAVIRDEWIIRAVHAPLSKFIPADGRIRRRVSIAEMENRYLRVVLLADGNTVHNAFFDRRFEP